MKSTHGYPTRRGTRKLGQKFKQPRIRLRGVTSRGRDSAAERGRRRRRSPCRGTGAPALAGLPLVMVNTTLAAPEAAYILAQSRCEAVFVEAAYRGNPLAQRIEELRPSLPHVKVVTVLAEWSADLLKMADASRPLPAIGPDQAGMILYTSGKTG